MAAISEIKFDRLLRRFERESVHLETRDAYGTETESRCVVRRTGRGQWI